MIPPPEWCAIELLRDDPELAALHLGRVSVEHLPGPVAVPVTLLPGGRSTSAWEWPATVQVDVWADDQITSGTLAALIRDRWPGQRREAGGALVAQTWVVSNPMALVDPDSHLPRYMLTLGLLVVGDSDRD